MKNKFKEEIKMFDAKSFLEGAYYAPLKAGVYTVQIKSTKVNVGNKCSLTLDLEFQSGRVISAVFWDKGIKFVCNDLRTQLQDSEDYPTAKAFIDTLPGKVVDVALERVVYTAKDGNIKSTFNYSFRKNAVDEDDVDLQIEL